jgi:hypothetical protein
LSGWISPFPSGAAAALAAVERGKSGRATFSGPLATDESVRVCGEYNAERLTGSSSVVQLAGRQRQFLLGAPWPCRAQFDGVDFRTRLAKADLDVLKAEPEKGIKQAVAEIISESEVPNDWRGEQFDLWSTVISVEGQRLRTAIAFKGPSKFRPMTIASLGRTAIRSTG